MHESGHEFDQICGQNDQIHSQIHFSEGIRYDFDIINRLKSSQNSLIRG